MAATFSNDTPDKGSGSRSASHKPGQASGAKKKAKVRPGITESGQPADKAAFAIAPAIKGARPAAPAPPSGNEGKPAKPGKAGGGQRGA